MHVLTIEVCWGLTLTDPFILFSQLCVCENKRVAGFTAREGRSARRFGDIVRNSPSQSVREPYVTTEYLVKYLQNCHLPSASGDLFNKFEILVSTIFGPCRLFLRESS